MSLLTSILADLPDGFTLDSTPQPTYTTAPITAPPAGGTPPVSGVLKTVASFCGCPVHIHRAAYDRPSPRGGYTLHSYAWRCTGCRHMTLGYLPEDGFSRAISDARTHVCEAHR